jgi:autotransporter translocation and assembly factor TamB
MKYVRKIIRTLIYAIAGMLVAGLVLLILLQNGTLNNQIVKLLTNQGNKKLNGELTIGSLEGNPLNLFFFNDIRISKKDTAVLFLDRLKINYNPEALFRKKLLVRNIGIEGLELEGKQRPDSSWSFMEVLPVKESKDQQKTDKPFDWQISVRQFRLDSIGLRLSPLAGTNIPSEIKTDGTFQFSMTADSMLFSVERFALKSESPDLIIEHMQGDFKKVDRLVSWKEVSVSFPETNIQTHGSTSLDSLSMTSASLNLNPLYLEDFHPWMGKTKLYGSPEIKANITNNAGRTIIDLNLREKKQLIALTAGIKNLETVPQYQVELRVDSLNGALWTREARYHSSLNGELQLRGRSFDPKMNNVRVSGDFRNTRYGNYEMDSLELRFNKTREDVKGSIRGHTKWGSIDLQLDMRSIFTNPGYAFHTVLKNIDLSGFTANKNLHSDLNLTIEASGKGIKPDSMTTRVDLSLSESSFLENPVSSANISADYNKGQYNLKELSIESAYLNLSSQGEGNVPDKIFLSFEFIPKEIRSLTSSLDLPVMDLKGKISGRVTGRMDSLNLTADYDLADLYYDTMTADRIYGDLSLLSRDSLFSGEIDLVADSAHFKKQTLQRLALESAYEGKTIKNRLDLKLNDTLSLSARTDVDLKKDPRISIHDLRIHAGPAEWIAGSDSTEISLGKDSIHVRNFALQSGTQQIGVNGILAFRGKEYLDFRVRNLDLSQVPSINGFDKRMTGIVNSEMLLRGNAANPTLRGSLEIHEPGLDTLKLEHFAAEFDYNQDTFYLESHVDAISPSSISTRLKMPLHISLADSFAMPGKDTPVQASLRLDSLDLTTINPLLRKNEMKVSGLLQSDADISNTLGEPRFNGKLSISNAAFDYPKEGISYQNIRLNSHFNNQRFVLDQAALNSGKGRLTLDGFADLNILTEKAKRNIRFHLDGENFTAVKSNKLEAVIQPSVSIDGTLEQPNVDGKVEITRATVNADAFREQLALRSDNPNPPLLVSATRDTVEKRGDTLQVAMNRQPVSGNNMYKNLILELNLEIPGNTWVKGKDMNFELQGSLRAIKRQQQIDLFGTLNVKRGFFEFYGKKFDFRRGTLTFTGGREVNPMLDFILEYSFRDPERELRNLTLNLSGRSRQPQLNFTLDGESIEEKDAISYLLFGKAMNRLSQGEQMSVEESATDIARSLAVGQVADLVSGALRSSFGLDVVEIGGGKTWKSGEVKIGKYITEDLYLSYQQNFAFDKRKKVIEPQKITLEYQLLRSLFLQATNQMPNSGFDLIFRKSWR